MLLKLQFFSMIQQKTIVGKGENAGYQHFLLFSQCFPKSSSIGLLKVGIVWERVSKQQRLKLVKIQRIFRQRCRSNSCSSDGVSLFIGQKTL